MGRPIASNASVCPPAKHWQIVTEMQAIFPAIGVSLVVSGRFFAPRHHRARGLPTCTRLKKMQGTACVKIGWPGPRMAVLSPLFVLYSVILGSRRSVTQKDTKVNQAGIL